MNQIHPEPLSGTLVDILEETAARYPEHGIFHVASGDTSEEFQSYPELLRNAKEMAQVLYRRGLRPRTPLILSVDASRTFLEIFWGCLFSGVLPAPLAHMRTPKADSMEAQKIFHVWEAIKAPIVADSSNERAFAVLTDMFKGTGATLIASEDLIGDRIVLIPVSDGEQRQILGMDVTFFDIHSTKAKQFGFHATLTDGRKLTCCGDEPLNPLCAPYVENSAWLLHEAFCLYEDRDRFNPYEKHHSTARDAAETARDMNAENIVLWHTEDTDLEHRRERYTAEAEALFHGGIFVPRDGDIIPLS